MAANPDMLHCDSNTKASLASCLTNKVEKTGDLVTPPLDLTVTYPHLSPRGNDLLYLTRVATSPQVYTLAFVWMGVYVHTSTFTLLFFYCQVKCDALHWINPHKINPKVVHPNPKKETLSVFLLVGDYIKPSGVSRLFFTVVAQVAY